VDAAGEGSGRRVDSRTPKKRGGRGGDDAFVPPARLACGSHARADWVIACAACTARRRMGRTEGATRARRGAQGSGGGGSPSPLSSAPASGAFRALSLRYRGPDRRGRRQGRMHLESKRGKGAKGGRRGATERPAQEEETPPPWGSGPTRGLAEPWGRLMRASPHGSCTNLTHGQRMHAHLPETGATGALRSACCAAVGAQEAGSPRGPQNTRRQKAPEKEP
jgi:hypothetical protein